MNQIANAVVVQMYKDGMEFRKNGNTPKALIKFQAVYKARPTSAEPLFQIGMIEYERFRYKSACAHLEKAASLKPAEVAIWREFGKSLRALNKPEHLKNAVSNLKKAAFPKPFEEQIKKLLLEGDEYKTPSNGSAPVSDIATIISLLDNRKFNEVDQRANALLRKFPDCVVAYNLLAVALIELGSLDHAEKSLRKAIELFPNFMDAHSNLGRVKSAKGKYKEALGHFARAREIKPDHIPSIIYIAKALGETGQETEAIELLETVSNPTKLDQFEGASILATLFSKVRRHDDAISLAEQLVEKNRKSPLAVIALGEALNNADKLEEAENAYKQGLERFPRHVDIMSKLANVVSILGRFDESREILRNAIKLAPLAGGLYNTYLQTTKPKLDDPIVQAMAENYENPDLGSESRTAFGYALSKAFEAGKKYDKVFYYLNSANAEERKAFPYDINERYRSYNQTVNFYKDFDLSKYEGIGNTEYRPIFVTGMPRSGTTLTEQIIASHSLMTAGGEDGRFRTAVTYMRTRPKNRLIKPDQIDSNLINEITSDFIDHFTNRLGETSHFTDKAIGSYTEIGLIKAAFPNAKIVLLRRDPRDNLLSIYKNQFARGSHGYSNDLRDLAKYYNVYLDYIDFWRETLPGEFYELDYEKLTDNPEEESRKLIDYCGLEWEDACLNFHENKSTVRTLSIYQARQPIYKSSVALWENYKEELKPMMEVLESRGK